MASKIGYQPIEGEQTENYGFSSGGYAASTRLNLQYYLFGEQTGYQVSPSISLDKENLKVADIGAGSGIWLVDLSKKVPASTTLDAFDITTDLIPNPKWRPENMHFHKLDVFKPIPDEFKRRYDVVHIRFFSPVVGAAGPVPVIKGALEMLKPGGVLQWDEREITATKTALGDGKTEAMQSLSDYGHLTMKKLNMNNDWIRDLDNIFKSCGLIDVKMEMHPTHRIMHGYLTEFLLQTVEEGAIGYDRMLGPSVGDEMRAKLAAAYEEHRIHGSSIATDMVVCVGRKAE